MSESRTLPNPQLFNPSKHVSFRELHTELQDQFEDDHRRGYDWMFHFAEKNNIQPFPVATRPGSRETMRVVTIADADELRRIFVDEYTEWKERETKRRERQKRIDDDHARRVAEWEGEQTEAATAFRNSRAIRELEQERDQKVRLANTSEEKIISAAARAWQQATRDAAVEIQANYEMTLAQAKQNTAEAITSIEDEYGEKIASRRVELGMD